MKYIKSVTEELTFYEKMETKINQRRKKGKDKKNRKEGNRNGRKVSARCGTGSSVWDRIVSVGQDRQCRTGLSMWDRIVKSLYLVLRIFDFAQIVWSAWSVAVLLQNKNNSTSVFV